MSIFTGSATAIITPFANDGIDFEILGRQIEFQIQNGTDALVVAGTTGEAATLSETEYRALIAFAVKAVAGRCPVIAGAGSNSTVKAIAMSRFAQSAGVDALLVVTPYYNKGTQAGIYAHYAAIAEAVSCPIIAYNVPSRTGLNMLPETVAALAALPTVVGVKEASGDIAQVAEILRRCPEGFAVYSGNDDSIVPVLSLGGKGVISVVANLLPQATHDLVAAYLSGDVARARHLQLQLNGVVNALFVETNPIPVKFAMKHLGMDSGVLRLPLTPLSAAHEPTVVKALTAFGLLKEAQI